MEEHASKLFRPGVRLCSAYALDCIDRTSRAIEQNLDLSVVFLATAWENVRESTMPTHADTEESAERRLGARAPISVYALARRLGLPYETTRRHVGALTRAGLCHKTPQGLVAPPLDAGRSARIVEETWTATEALLDDLARLGLQLPRSNRRQAQQLKRRVARLSIEYFLAGLEKIEGALGADTVNAVLFLTINRLNLAPLFEDPELALRQSATGGVAPDDLRRPVTTYALARTVGLPYETTRRHVARLVDGGWCERAAGNALIVPGRVLKIPAMEGASLGAWEATQRFVRALAELGMPMPARRSQAA